MRWTRIDFITGAATSAENARTLAGLGIHVAHPPATPYGEIRVIASDHGRIRIAIVLSAWSFVCAGPVTTRHPLLDILKTRLRAGRDYAVEVAAHYGDRSLGTFKCLLSAGVPAQIAARYAAADSRAYPGA